MTPIHFTGEAEASVDAYNAQDDAAKSASFWISDDAAAPKKQAKDHYIQQQLRKCCYCMREISSVNNYMWDLEHIISKNTKPEFLFEPRNLAACCRDCNLIKGDQETRRNPKRKSFPDKSEHYTIVHPHFDSYYEHIKWYGPVVVAKSTDKGTETIKMCNLLRYSAEKLGGISRIDDRRFDDLVGQLHSARSLKDAEVVLEMIKVVLSHVDFLSL